MIQKGITRFRKGDVVKAKFHNKIIKGIIRRIYKIQDMQRIYNFHGKPKKVIHWVWAASVVSCKEDLKNPSSIGSLVYLTDILDVEK